jgi:uncharacterized membrane protein
MKKGRLEAFSDGVIAIIITIMVLEFKVPAGNNISSLTPMIPVIFGYLISFINVGIYWNNHHHMIYMVDKINGKVLWANLNLLFWLSLVPFATAWMGATHFSKWPVALYGVILFMTAVAYTIISYALIGIAGKNSLLAEALGDNWKGKVSLVIYAVAVGVTFINSWFGFSLYWVVAIIWFLPDPRIEKRVVSKDEQYQHGTN